jgi:hypothetical protein
MHFLENLTAHGITIDSPEHKCQMLSVMAEVNPYLSPAGRCGLVNTLVGVIVDERSRPVKLLFELADRGSLEDYIKRGWEAATTGGCGLTRFEVFLSGTLMRRLPPCSAWQLSLSSLPPFAGPAYAAVAP